jgi:hypothetical protein
MQCLCVAEDDCWCCECSVTVAGCLDVGAVQDDGCEVPRVIVEVGSDVGEHDLVEPHRG